MSFRGFVACPKCRFAVSRFGDATQHNCNKCHTTFEDPDCLNPGSPDKLKEFFKDPDRWESSRSQTSPPSSRRTSRGSSWGGNSSSDMFSSNTSVGSGRSRCDKKIIRSQRTRRPSSGFINMEEDNSSTTSGYCTEKGFDFFHRERSLLSDLSVSSSRNSGRLSDDFHDHRSLSPSSSIGSESDSRFSYDFHFDNIPLNCNYRAPRRGLWEELPNPIFPSANREESRKPRRKMFPCRPVSGGINFVFCYRCLMVLQLPEDFKIAEKKTRKLRCGRCQEVLLYSVIDRIHIVPRDYVPGENYSTGANKNNPQGALHRLMGYFSARDITYEAEVVDNQSL